MAEPTPAGPVGPKRFDEAYLAGTPPWDIGRPQARFVAAEADGRVAGRVLDAGCGTGELALFMARQGHEVVGIDSSPTAIARARAKALERQIDARFEVGDLLDMQPDTLGGPFDTVLDSGVFHVFSDAERPRYAEGLRRVTRPGGRLHILVFSEHEPLDWGGPRRVSQDEIQATFAAGWRIDSIAPARFETVDDDISGHAWHAELVRS